MVGRSWRAKAQRRWGKETQIINGNGQFAFLTWCRVLEVTLFPTRDEAEEFKKNIDRYKCGGGCTGNHEIIDLSIAKPSN